MTDSKTDSKIEELEEKIENLGSQSESAPKVEIATGGSGMITTGGTAISVEGRTTDTTEDVKNIAIEAFASVLSEESKNVWRQDNR
ncbi:hypothetical protein E4P24_02825 [Haloferax sp. AS1]|uniref:hypothetical protein n=1 Tax=Haloferax sp. AS1 TaxID=2562277 RepID=UPI00165F2CBB|nr:hypothetical protein [Haloferax sp. AS1]MBC9985305.1 hypothetical protein [Haloferax sp. AS1]